MKDQPHTRSSYPNPLLRDDSHGDLTEYEEQSEAGSNSPISLPNRIRSDDENSYHRGFNDVVNAIAGVAHTFCKGQPQKREPCKCMRHKVGQSDKEAENRSSCNEVEQETLTADGSEDPLT